MNRLRVFFYRPFIRRIPWFAFAVVFFYSGLYFTELLLQPEVFAGGPLRWTLVVMFPVLVPLFFVVNKHFGCATGSCSVSVKPDRCANDRSSRVPIMRMPGA